MRIGIIGNDRGLDKKLLWIHLAEGGLYHGSHIEELDEIHISYHSNGKKNIKWKYIDESRSDPLGRGMPLNQFRGLRRIGNHIIARKTLNKIYDSSKKKRYDEIFNINLDKYDEDYIGISVFLAEPNSSIVDDKIESLEGDYYIIKSTTPWILINVYPTTLPNKIPN
jgi:hypothetical protein